MAKGKGGSKTFQGKDTFQRMNFLYQASHAVLGQSGDLPAYFGRSMLSIAQKSVLKIEPSIKRDFCKGCGNLLKPGVSVKVRIRSGRMVCTCLRCGTIKRFPTKKGYKLWIETSDACLEVFEVPNSTEIDLSSTKESVEKTSSVSVKSVKTLSTDFGNVQDKLASCS